MSKAIESFPISYMTSSGVYADIPNVSFQFEVQYDIDTEAKQSTVTSWSAYIATDANGTFTNKTDEEPNGWYSFQLYRSNTLLFPWASYPDTPIVLGNNQRYLLASGSTSIVCPFTRVYVGILEDLRANFVISYSNSRATCDTGSFFINFERRTPDVSVLNFTNFTDIDNPVVSYSLGYTSGVTLTAKVSIGNWWITRTIDNPKTNGTYSFVMDAIETVTLYSETWNTNTATATVTLTAKTAYGSSTATGSSIFTINGGYPQLAPTYQIIETSSGGSSLIYGDNKITVNCNATFLKGAEAGTFRIACGNKVSNESSATFTNVESNIITCTVTDSRGNTSTKSITITEFVDYIPLTCVVESTNPVENEDGSVTAKFNISGAIYTGQINGTANTLVLQYRITKNGVAATWITKPSDEITIIGNKYSAVVTTSFPKTDRILIDVKAQDNVKEVTTTSPTVTLTPVFDWSGTDFNFNVPIYLNGKLIPLISESGTFTSGNYTFYYRKWNDGVSEAWGHISGSVTIPSSSNFGGLYSSDEIPESNIIFPEGLFIDRPDVIAQLESRGAVGFLVGSTTAASATQSGSYQIVQPSYGSYPNYTICYQIRGRWKV